MHSTNNHNHMNKQSKPEGYLLIGPDNLPLFPDPYPTLDELVCAAARFLHRHYGQGHYLDASGVQQTLEWVTDNLSVRVVPVRMTATQAYTKYVSENLERIESEGWTPLSFLEFVSSEECDNEMVIDTPPKDDEWAEVGVVGVDSGQLMLCDPCYIENEWKKADAETRKVAPAYRHKDGTVLYCTLHGTAPEKDAIGFDSYSAVVEKYGKTMNQMGGERVVYAIPAIRKNPGEFSYSGCCTATEDRKLKGGQLHYTKGHAGAGVVTRTGFGDGVYPVLARYEDGDWGRRVAELRVVFIGDEDDETDDAQGDHESLPAHTRKLCTETGTNSDEWTPTDGPSTGVGTEYWYRHKDGRTAYVCDDQGRITVELHPAEEDSK